MVKFVVKHVNAAPIMRDIPDHTIKEDDNNGVIAVIKLDQFARDKDNRFVLSRLRPNSGTVPKPLP